MAEEVRIKAHGRTVAADGLATQGTRTQLDNNIALCQNRQISNISRTKFQNLNVSCLALQLSLFNPLTPEFQVENEGIVGAVLTGDAPTTSEWWTILLATNGCLILES